jgi:hypothetical protein
VVGQIFLGQGQVLDRHQALAWLQVEDSIDQDESHDWFQGMARVPDELGTRVAVNRRPAARHSKIEWVIVKVSLQCRKGLRLSSNDRSPS